MKQRDAHQTRGWSLEAKVAYYTDVGKPGECWPWQSSRNPKGYPEIKWEGRKRQVHRLMSGVPDHLQVRHTCDNAWCVNPAHWLFGTNDDNVNDKRARGRLHLSICLGEKNGLAKLTRRDVQQIKWSLEKSSVLATRFNVSQNAIWKIRRGLTWTHVQPEAETLGL